MLKAHVYHPERIAQTLANCVQLEILNQEMTANYKTTFNKLTFLLASAQKQLGRT